MSNVKIAQRLPAGAKATAAGAAPQTMASTLTLNGITLSYTEWQRRGVIRVTGITGNNVDFHLLCKPEIAG